MKLFGILTLSLLALSLLALAACPAKKGSGGAAAAIWGNASDFSFNTAEGKTVKLSSYGGRPLVVNFWAVW